MTTPQFDLLKRAGRPNLNFTGKALAVHTDMVNCSINRFVLSAGKYGKYAYWRDPAGVNARVGSDVHDGLKALANKHRIVVDKADGNPLRSSVVYDGYANLVSCTKILGDALGKTAPAALQGFSRRMAISTWFTTARPRTSQLIVTDSPKIAIRSVLRCKRLTGERSRLWARLRPQP